MNAPETSDPLCNRHSFPHCYDASFLGIAVEERCMGCRPWELGASLISTKHYLLEYLEYLLQTCKRDINEFNHLKPNGYYVSHLLQQSVALHFVFMGFVWFSL
jgi:hypothetical protein